MLPLAALATSIAVGEPERLPITPLQEWRPIWLSRCGSPT